MVSFTPGANVHNVQMHSDSHLLNLPHILQSIVVVVEENQGLEAAQLHLVNLDQPKVENVLTSFFKHLHPVHLHDQLQDDPIKVDPLGVGLLPGNHLVAHHDDDDDDDDNHLVAHQVHLSRPPLSAKVHTFDEGAVRRPVFQK